MLFSREDVAGYINQNFEAAWETVRAVPIVRIDFGNGNVLTRTLHGNIASYVCAADGEVLDILPGIYAPEPYLDRLRQFRLLANYVDQLGKEKRPERLRAYHEGQAVALKKNELPPRLVNTADRSKEVIEGGIKAVLKPTRPKAEKAVPQPLTAEPDPKVVTNEDLSSWKLLARDTELNEQVRRLQIHEMLADSKGARPEKLVKWLYREVLHSDLDDPYLGLGKVLFEGYVFEKEDKPH